MTALLKSNVTYADDLRSAISTAMLDGSTRVYVQDEDGHLFVISGIVHNPEQSALVLEVTTAAKPHGFAS